MKTFKTLLFVVTIAFASSAFAVCESWPTPGPPISFPRLNDPNFATDECWTFAFNAYHDGTNQVGVLDGLGSIAQSTSFSGESWDIYEMVIDVNAITDGSPGTETLKIEIVHSGGTDVIDTISPSAGNDDYYYLLGDYDNQTITVRARYLPGNSPGGTVYKIDNFSLWLTP